MNAPIYLTEQEIKSKIDYSRQKSSIYFREKQLYLGSIYPKSSLPKVNKVCEEYASKDLVCLLIENETSLTLWLEKESSELNKDNHTDRSTSSANPIIACIDDSKTIQYAVKASLEPVGYEVLNILKPTEQLDILLIKKPILIFLDINMPDISGYKLCEKLKRFPETRDTPIVMLTGSTGTIDRVRAKLNGANKYMTKPFTPQQLISTIKELV